ncbi:MAG: hypothetical protein RIE24_06710 [Silicimonas sp.]
MNKTGLLLERVDMVENYTNAFLVSAFVLTFVALFAVWALWGMIMAGLVGWTADRLITVDFGKDVSD